MVEVRGTLEVEARGILTVDMRNSRCGDIGVLLQRRRGDVLDIKAETRGVLSWRRDGVCFGQDEGHARGGCAGGACYQDTRHA